MDAGSMALFSLACLLLFKLAGRFAKAVDKATMEVADYTVVIKGLPETTPIDVSTADAIRADGLPLPYQRQRWACLFWGGKWMSASSVAIARSWGQLYADASLRV